MRAALVHVHSHVQDVLAELPPCPCHAGLDPLPESRVPVQRRSVFGKSVEPFRAGREHQLDGHHSVLANFSWQRLQLGCQSLCDRAL